jgi:Protein of unknown function (DUF992)
MIQARIVFCLLLAGMLWSVGATGSRADIGRTYVGTLTCTVAPAALENWLETRELSCVFEPIAGIKGTFAGTISRMGDTAPTADQLVLVWQVLAREPIVAMGELEGRYSGIISDGTGELVSGEVGLRPMSELPEGTPNFAPLVLELDLKQLKA